MRLILYGASGMVGQGALREALRDPGVTEVLAVGRAPLQQKHEKLKELTLPDDYATVEDKLRGYDACICALGITSNGADEATYTRITHDLPLAAAQALARVNPQMTFVFVSGRGTDSASQTMWARVKGKTEDDLLALPLKVFVFRPAGIQPLDGIRSRTRLYNILFALTWPLWPLLRWLFPGSVSTTRELGRALIDAARTGAPKKILESTDIRALA